MTNSGRLFWVVLLIAAPSGAADVADAYVDCGLGLRAVGMGRAFIAVVDDAGATYWNPAGLATTQGRHVLVANQPMSLDRRQYNASVTENFRGELGIGMGWLHAGVGEIIGRRSDGLPTGTINDRRNTLYLAVGRSISRQLALGITLKVHSHRISTPGTTNAIGKGSGFDIGAKLNLTDAIAIASTLRNLWTKLAWQVPRTETLSSTTEDNMATIAGIGLAVRPLTTLHLALDICNDGTDSFANLGTEWTLSPLLILRGGLYRAHRRDTGQPTFGLTIRPMQRRTVQFQFAYTTDPIDASSRTSFGLSLNL